MPISNLTTCLDLLGSSGIVLSNEQKAVLETSLPLKKVEAGLKMIKFWGKFITVNGKDYLLAIGLVDQPYVFDGKVHMQYKYFYSQNGVHWLDLGPLDEVTYGRAGTINGFLTGEPGHKYVVEEPAPEPEKKEGEEPPAETEPEGEEGEENTGPEPLKFDVTEVQRLRFMMENIQSGTGLVPDGYYTTNAKNEIAANQLFAGLPYPDKLESFTHGPLGCSVKKDVTGSWSLHRDSFKCLTILRSLAYPGYSFVYSCDMKEFDSIYLGDGQANKDLMFMIA